MSVPTKTETTGFAAADVVPSQLLVLVRAVMVSGVGVIVSPPAKVFWLPRNELVGVKAALMTSAAPVTRNWVGSVVKAQVLMLF